MRVVDGDTIKIDRTTYRLVGIDAPEIRQRCGAREFEWKCGVAAKAHLSSLIKPNALRCDGEKRDRYGRTLATCFNGHDNINQRMVADGWAVNYRTDTIYLSEQVSAEKSRGGIWRGSFEMPWEYRRRQRN